MKKAKTGRPQRYTGEAAKRLSVTMRPRYREAVSLLAQHRGSSISEAMEYLIAMGTRQYILDGKPLLDYLRPKNERYIVLSFKARNWLAMYQRRKPDMEEESEWLEAEHAKFEKIPKSVRTPFQVYYWDIFNALLNSTPDIWALRCYFNYEQVIAWFQESWKQGYSEEETHDFFKAVYKEALEFHDLLYTYAQTSKLEGDSFTNHFIKEVAALGKQYKELGEITPPYAETPITFDESDKKILAECHSSVDIADGSQNYIYSNPDIAALGFSPVK